MQNNEPQRSSFYDLRGVVLHTTHKQLCERRSSSRCIRRTLTWCRSTLVSSQHPDGSEYMIELEHGRRLCHGAPSSPGIRAIRSLHLTFPIRNALVIWTIALQVGYVSVNPYPIPPLTLPSLQPQIIWTWKLQTRLSVGGVTGCYLRRQYDGHPACLPIRGHKLCCHAIARSITSQIERDAEP
jgi:hypothetical protein